MKQYKITENNITYDIEVHSNGTKKWYLNGLLHRENGPAIETFIGDKFWYKNGVLHRENGPASEYDDGSKFWYINDSLHKEDGPAIELCDGYKEYWYNNKRLLNINSDQEFKRYIKLLSIS